jgi:gamma-glutamyl-gamma-aminobutyrate hydrolase PuuD
MTRLVSALWEDFHPFDQLPGISDYARAQDTDDLKPGDILITHGGEDISPSIYGQRANRYTSADNWLSNRDTIEVNLINRAKELDVPVIGICRGAQLLCALNGGILVQHVTGHSGSHPVRTFDNGLLTVNSIHHQMQYPWTGKCKYELVAWSKTNRSNTYVGEDEIELEVDCEPEFIYYPDVKGFGIQWHPEMMDGESLATKYVLQYIKETLCL